MRGKLTLEGDLGLWLGKQGADDDTRVYVRHFSVEGDLDELVDIFADKLKATLRENLEKRNARLQESIRVDGIQKGMMETALAHIPSPNGGDAKEV